MGIRLTDGVVKTPYIYRPFPKYVRHTDGRACVVADDAAWMALGPGWGHPSDVEPVADVVADPVSDEPKPRGRKRKVDAER